MKEKAATLPSPTPRTPSPVPREKIEATDELRSARWFRFAPLLVLLLTVAVAGAVVVLYLRQDAAERVESARGDALQAARQHVPQVLSYRHESLDRDLDTATKATTGAFTDELSDLQRTVIRPAAIQDKISTNTTVSDAGVVRATEREVVVLAFINQMTTSQKQATPRIDGARIRVTMARVDDGWLVSRVDTV